MTSERKEAFLNAWFDAPKDTHWSHGMSNKIEEEVSNSFDNAIAAYTRAVPDVPELVRYGISMFGNGAVEMGEGEYVLYSESAAVIAAKDAEIERLTCPTYLEEKLIQVGVCDIEWQKRAEAAEAKLAQIKAQEPVAWMHPEARWTDVSKQEVAVHCKVGTYPLPLYDSPVSDSMKAECDRYKEALGLCQRTLAMIIDPKSIVSTTSIIAFASATEAEAKARAAIKGDSHDKG